VQRERETCARVNQAQNSAPKHVHKLWSWI